MTLEGLPHITPPTPSPIYRTEPALNVGSENQQSRSLVVGQRSDNPEPQAAFLLGSVAEQTVSKNRLNWSIWLDATFPHVMLISGKRGSGKSYDLGIICEALCAVEQPIIARGTEDFAMILFDTQNQFWTLGQSGARVPEDQEDSINVWKINGSSIKHPTVFRPKGTQQLLDLEEEFSIRPQDLSPEDWLGLWELDRFTPMGHCLTKVRSSMSPNFDVEDMIEWLDTNDAEDQFADGTREAIKMRLDQIIETDLFDSGAPDIAERLIKKGSKSVIQLAELPSDTKAVVTSVIMRKVLNFAGPAQRRRRIAEMTNDDVDPSRFDIAPRIWALIDEAHLICPNDSQTSASNVVVDYVRRGRDAGLSLVVATQQPSALDTKVVSQCDIVTVHKLTIEQDIRAATTRMPTPMPTSVSVGSITGNVNTISDLSRALGAGQALFADSESDRAFILRSRPRVTPHGGGEPSL